MTTVIIKDKIYVLDVDFSKDLGGAGKASEDIVLGLTKVYKVYFIPKYAEIKNIIKSETREAFLEFAGRLLNYGILIPSSITEYVMTNSNVTLREYIQLLTKVVEKGALILDLNYFPYLDPSNLQDLFKEFFFYGEVYYLKKCNKCRVAVLLQTLDNRPINSHFTFALKCLIKFRYFNLHFLLKSLYLDLKNLIIIPKLFEFSDKILLYSVGSLLALKVKRHHKKFQILKVGNTIDRKCIVVNKKDYIIYFARLIPEKGIFDVLYIFRNIAAHSPVKLVIAGNFKDNNLKEAFFQIAKKQGLSKNISYVGFVPEYELDQLIKYAKIFIYPSHYDSFPYAILESLSSHTVVLTYNIPSLKYAFEKLECVKFVKEFDFFAMAREALKLLIIDKDEYASIFQSEHVREFVKVHEKGEDSTNEIANYIINFGH